MADGSDVTKLHSMMDRAQKLSGDLAAIYTRDLSAKTVSDEALNITHEVIEKCCNALDQAMSLFAVRYIYPHLSKPPKRGGYFPAGADEERYQSTMKGWGATNLAEIAPKADATVRSLQPFSSPSNAIYASIKEFSAHKHRGLLPQKRIENTVTHITNSSGGLVSYSEGARFSAGVQVFGAYIDPKTNRPFPGQNVDTKLETWVTFLIEGSNQNALSFCSDAVAATRAAINVLHPPTA